MWSWLFQSHSQSQEFMIGCICNNCYSHLSSYHPKEENVIPISVLKPDSQKFSHNLEQVYYIIRVETIAWALISMFSQSLKYLQQRSADVFLVNWPDSKISTCVTTLHAVSEPRAWLFPVAMLLTRENRRFMACMCKTRRPSPSLHASG